MIHNENCHEKEMSYDDDGDEVIMFEKPNESDCSIFVCKHQY